MKTQKRKYNYSVALELRFGKAMLQQGYTIVPNLFLQNYYRLEVSDAAAMFVNQLLQYKWDERDPYPRITWLPMTAGEKTRRTYLREFRRKGLIFTRRRYYTADNAPEPRLVGKLQAQEYNMTSLFHNLVRGSRLPRGMYVEPEIPPETVEQVAQGYFHDVPPRIQKRCEQHYQAEQHLPLFQRTALRLNQAKPPTPRAQAAPPAAESPIIIIQTGTEQLQEVDITSLPPTAARARVPASEVKSEPGRAPSPAEIDRPAMSETTTASPAVEPARAAMNEEMPAAERERPAVAETIEEPSAIDSAGQAATEPPTAAPEEPVGASEPEPAKLVPAELLPENLLVANRGDSKQTQIPKTNSKQEEKEESASKVAPAACAPSTIETKQVVNSPEEPATTRGKNRAVSLLRSLGIVRNATTAPLFVSPPPVAQIQAWQEYVETQPGLRNKVGYMIKRLLAAENPPIRAMEVTNTPVKQGEVLNTASEKSPEELEAEREAQIEALIAQWRPPERSPEEELWASTLCEMQLQIPKAFHWIQHSVVTAWEEGKLTVALDHAYAVDWVNHRLLPTIQRTLSNLAGHPMEVEFAVG